MAVRWWEPTVWHIPVRGPAVRQSINFFQLDEDSAFVDLPGYGFCKSSKHITREWKELIESYLLWTRCGCSSRSWCWTQDGDGWNATTELKDWLRSARAALLSGLRRKQIS